MVGEFMHVYGRWPDAIVQFEDFKHRKRFVPEYKDKYRMFNDDIQGTGSVFCLAY